MLGYVFVFNSDEMKKSGIRKPLRPYTVYEKKHYALTKFQVWLSGHVYGGCCVHNPRTKEITIFVYNNCSYVGVFDVPG